MDVRVAVLVAPECGSSFAQVVGVWSSDTISGKMVVIVSEVLVVPRPCGAFADGLYC